jgi:hypothetical protein
MTGNQEIPGRKRRSSEEIKRLVLEFEASGLRQNAFCRNQGLALSTLQRQLKRRRSDKGEAKEGSRLVAVELARKDRMGIVERLAHWKWCSPAGGGSRCDRISIRAPWKLGTTAETRFSNRKALFRDRNQTSSGRFSPWSDDQMPSAVFSARSIDANSRSTPKIVQVGLSRTGQF